MSTAQPWLAVAYAPTLQGRGAHSRASPAPTDVRHASLPPTTRSIGGAGRSVLRLLAIDNNAAERALRGVAVGRKNWLFWGSDRGGKTAAILTSFTATCKRHGIDPWSYLSDVLTRLPSHPSDRVAELLPDAWAKARRSSS